MVACENKWLPASVLIDVEDDSAQLIIRNNNNLDPEDYLTTRRALSHHEAPAFLMD
jgi:hypothetical protein